MMETTAVRALLAYGITLGFFACFVLIIFVPLTQVQMTLAGTMMGALLANWKMPLTYFYDGLPKAPAPTPADAPQPSKENP